MLIFSWLVAAEAPGARRVSKGIWGKSESYLRKIRDLQSAIRAKSFSHFSRSRFRGK